MNGLRGAWRVFRIPLLLAVVSGFGLISALLVEGPMDLLWSLAVAVPVLAVCAALARSRRPR